MSKRTTRIKEDVAEYYERHGVLGDLEDRTVEFALDEELRRQILAGLRMFPSSMIRPRSRRSASSLP